MTISNCGIGTGTLERIHHMLYVVVREQAGREASPTTATGAREWLSSFRAREHGNWKS
jgi:hypothetical protein